MIYYSNERLIIRDLHERDIPYLVEEEIAQGWHSTPEKLEIHLADKETMNTIVLAAEVESHAVGYICIYPDSKWGAFGGQGLPELVDFAVLEKFRGQGIGTALMTIAETLAAQHANIVYLGVGLHSGYGAAQRMYVRRGYIPDGSGVWYGDKVCEQYAPCANDDDLVLYMSKKLRMNQ